MLSIDEGRAYFRRYGLEERVLEFEVSSATVGLAAAALGVDAARIAKTLAFRTAEGCLLVLTAGDAKIDNKKYKLRFGQKAKMLSAEELPALVGHPMGGVCPFGIRPGVPVYLDVSMQRFGTVFPAVGSDNSAIELDMDELWRFSNAQEWVDVCLTPLEKDGT